MATPELVERVVIGNKSYSWIDPNPAEGERKRKLASPGETVLVTIKQALTFPHRLQDPKVAEANAEAARVAFEAGEVARQAAVAVRRGVTLDTVIEEEEDEDED